LGHDAPTIAYTNLNPIRTRTCKIAVSRDQEMFRLTGASITSLAIITKDRPVSLNRCLSSLLANCARNNRTPEIMVIDGSVSPNALIANRQIVAQAQRKSVNRFTVRYWGKQDTDDLICRIRKSTALPCSVLDFALKGLAGISVNTGANRNVQLLTSVGRMSMTVDDDIICQTYTRRSDREQNRPPSSGVYTEFYLNESSLNDSLLIRNDDVLKVHEQVLGKTVAGNREGSEDAYISISMMGVAGSLTSDSPIIKYYKALRNAHLAYPRDRATHEALLRAGIFLRMADQYVICNATDLSSYCLGMDNRLRLPPWMPGLRSQDLVLGSVLKAIPVYGCLCAAPRAVWHARPEPHAINLRSAFERSALVTGGEFIAAMIDDYRSHTVSLERSLVGLGRYLAEFASGDLVEVENRATSIVRKIMRSRLGAFVSMMETRQDWPGFLRREIEWMIRFVNKALLNPERHLVTELPDNQERLHSSLFLLTRKYGEIMMYWDDISRAVEI
jgi:hypothetical protein